MNRFQALARAGFMRVEALFNRAFGDRLNPFYHLGEISFGCFWLVAASGLYLYAFFETGVAGAYDSVRALSETQWFAGGVLRSLHRYASDAMVVTLMLHMLRHFAFDRLRGFRWFSWVSGVALIWGVCLAGVVGYMLPWDRLAQFVIVATFEWLDWLPGFGGTLVRNVIHPSSVTDRFFSLLTFMHIGVPLVVLLLLWIHVQRVPKARTMPPRPLAISLGLSLLTLCLIVPVSSQGGAAELGSVPALLRLDWFYLALFPLLYEWPLARVWGLLGVATVFLAGLPWLRVRRRDTAAAFEVVIEGVAEPLTVRSGETILEAGLRQDLGLAYECRNGACAVCECSVLHGDVDHGQFQPAALPEQARARGKALMCCARPLSDLRIALSRAPSTGARMIATRRATVQSIERLAPEVIRLMLSLPPGERIDFAPGQYLNVVLDDGQRRAYSFASAPGDDPRIELHVRRMPGGRFTGRVFGSMAVGDTLLLEGPLGSAAPSDGERPLIFVAGATGFAPVKSILEDAFARGSRRPMSLYWGVRHHDDLYLGALAQHWAAEHPNFRYVPVLSDAQGLEPWGGRRGLVHEAMLADHPDMRGYEVYVCGSVRMVQAAVPAFIAQGLDEASCFTDAFVPARTGQGIIR